MGQCDETLPSCARCRRRREVCSYLEQYSPPPTVTLPLRLPPFSIERPDAATEHLEDMDLAHIFLTETYATLWSGTRGQMTWRDTVWKAALRQPALLNGILAMAAMHKVVAMSAPPPPLPHDTDPGPSPGPDRRYQVMALRKQAATLPAFVALLAKLDETTCHDSFVLSILVCFWAFASRNLPVQLGIFDAEGDPASWRNVRANLPATNPVNDFVQICRKLKPITILTRQCHGWLKQGPMSAFMETPAIDDLPSLGSDAAHALDKLERRLEIKAPHLLDFGSAQQRPLLSFRFAYRAVQCREWLELAIAWPSLLPEVFVEELETGSEAALTVLSYWAVAFQPLDIYWWAKGWAAALVIHIAARVRGEWAELVKWPLETIVARKGGIASSSTGSI
ncbi:hypothetical protein QQS21_009852 [Conoideocrella luteorostrata]|uniref:Zn(2)-C6 fungal-type domain-containing protein n=1 Tax=Conoideocrella luteorostrata TaxID=1105319 RepID=A0AAJ0FPY2_9HYPO|nr:hypothetical protein QQS21_009852 [Conoideocrella luteorostrata]